MIGGANRDAKNVENESKKADSEGYRKYILLDYKYRRSKWWRGSKILGHENQDKVALETCIIFNIYIAEIEDFMLGRQRGGIRSWGKEEIYGACTCACTI